MLYLRQRCPLPLLLAEEVRQETVHILKASGKPSDNLPGAERRVLRSLRTNADLKFLRADKGNATVVLDTKDYKEKVSALLSAPTYRRLHKEPTESAERKTTFLLKKSSLPEEVVQQLQSQGSRPPRLYGIPKIYMERKGPSAAHREHHRLAQHLAGLLGAHIAGFPHHVRNSMEFINTINTLRAGPRDILVSFDAVSLFIMVPIEEALRLLSRHLDEAILRLFRHVLTSSFFSFNGQFYEKTNGVAMGSPLSPVIANSFMEYFEEMAL
jgi:hypothetical protein